MTPVEEKKRQQDLGIFYTPEVVVDFMYDMLNVLKEKEDEESGRWESRKPSHFPSVIDPACGEGIFLKKAIQSGFTGYHPRYKVPYIFGADIDTTVVERWEKLSILSLFHGNRENMQKHFYGQNGLLPLPDHHLPYKKKEDGLMQFDAVVGNPPYGGIGVDFEQKLNPGNKILLDELSTYEIFRWRARKQIEKQNTQQESMFSDTPKDELPSVSQTDIVKYAQGTPIEILFIERFIKLAKEGGWISVIIPDGILANANAHYVREFIAHTTKVLAIVSLPRETFKHMGTNAKTSILLLQKEAHAPDALDYPVFLASIVDLNKEYFDLMVHSFHSFLHHGKL